MVVVIILNTESSQLTAVNIEHIVNRWKIIMPSVIKISMTKTTDSTNVSKIKLLIGTIFIFHTGNQCRSV